MAPNSDSPQAERIRIPVVGIGASAGGIGALQKFFEVLPSNCGAALVVIVHLDPEHTSELPSILSAQTSMRVVQAQENQQLCPDTVYVIPPNRRLLISGDNIGTAAFDEPRGRRAPIDLFFRSLAEQHGDGYAVILSGGGSDGSVGVRAMKEKGGIILVQDPDEAEFASMPRNAIISGADFVLPVRDLARQLSDLLRIKSGVALRTADEGAEDLLRQILAFLRTKTGQDFSRYKRATVMRRVARRMQVAQTERLDDYLRYLRENSAEVQALFNDLLISVTNFFRDPDAFKVLANEVIPKLFENEQRDNVIRVWVPACATGEEAYSIAILLLEEAGRRNVRPEIQIFASDLDARSLLTAREGCYPSAILADVSDERLRRYFVQEGDHYRICREVRDTIVFAQHSLLKDPTFSRLNLISCRNLLIYLDRELQAEVCSTLHYGLLPNGYLFLGISESAENPPGLFVTVSREARIYQAVDLPNARLPPLGRLKLEAPIPQVPLRLASLSRLPARVDSSLHRKAMEEMAPPSMLVDEGHLIVNLSESCGRFLFHPGGPMTNDAADVVRPELRLELRAALHRAFERNESTVSLLIPVRFEGTSRAVVLHVRPLNRGDAARAAVVMFIEGGEAEPSTIHGADGDEASTVDNLLREELYATRTVLRTTREQYESTTEELRAANEELQSINEEYRSTAEELETSKEELQSINEELQTVNNEMKVKLEMVSRAHNDLENFMTATDVGTMFLDSALRIQRFTPRMVEVFNFVAGDEGRSITDFTHRMEYQDLVVDARRVLADLIPIERTVRTTNGRWFLMRLRPYRTLDDKIEGVVATFVDVTERRAEEEAWEERQRMLLDELTHRFKNTLAVIQVIIAQTLRDSGASKAAIDTLNGRLLALAHTHQLLVDGKWRGANLEAVARQQLAPYLALSGQLELSGPSVTLPPFIATPLGLALHELGTNSVKYGAFHSPEGRVELSWRVLETEHDARQLEVIWSESDGPPVKAPERKGAGCNLIERGVPGAHVKQSYKPDGLVCTFVIPLLGDTGDALA